MNPTTKAAKHTREDEVARATVDAALMVHRTLGPGLLESVYEKCVAAELIERGFAVEVQKQIPIAYRNLRLDAGFRADLLVDDRVLVELKAVESLLNIHTAQVLTYLKLTGIHIALLINFNTALLKDGIKRLAL
ncbi:MAG: GxxExxY protein [Terrimicrobiaceae bacterium]|nr:GxxExxY protein [Terrimicrobiaceae bacterium]